MKVRNLLFGFILAMMVLFAGNINSTASPAARTCASECQSTYDACKSGCGLDGECLMQCFENYKCCKALCIGAHCTN
jgi:hypothetical protein